MKKRDITDLEDCYYKIEALLKEYNCEIWIDTEDDNKPKLVDRDTKSYEQLPHTAGFED